MIPTPRTGRPAASLSVIWGVWVRDIRRKRTPWRFIEAHATRDVAFAHRERLQDPILAVVVRRCSVGEVV